MAITLLIANKNTLLDQINTMLNAGTGAATIKVYDGTQPANADTALSGNTLLAEFAMTDPAAPAAASGDLTLSAIGDDISADATGTASWARIADSNGLTVFDVDVTATGGGGGMEFNTVSFVILKTISVSSFTVSL